jgi:hypothetical protein
MIDELAEAIITLQDGLAFTRALATSGRSITALPSAAYGSVQRGVDPSRLNSAHRRRSRRLICPPLRPFIIA